MDVLCPTDNSFLTKTLTELSVSCRGFSARGWLKVNSTLGIKSNSSKVQSIQHAAAEDGHHEAGGGGGIGKRAPWAPPDTTTGAPSYTVHIPRLQHPERVAPDPLGLLNKKKTIPARLRVRSTEA